MRTLAVLTIFWIAAECIGPFRISAQEPSQSEETTAGVDVAESSDKKHKHTNRLAGETSPYLLQHAHNPVNWYPWCDEAFEKAKQENKPIFLSVGYSTCYWCHVMEVESFENEEVAAVINEHFIAIKVDREERPDIDEQFMLVTQLITQRGGWPNSIWLRPDGKAWMAGTYFPKQHFIDSLKGLADVWKTRRDEVDRQTENIAAAIKRINRPVLAGDNALTFDIVNDSVALLAERFDNKLGGIRGKPKFPPHGTLDLLIHQLRSTGDQALLAPITQTLDAMWLGGIHDHIGGGFHRYSTDEQWLLPHFEKMLYDNAQLLRLYVDGYSLTGDEMYREAVADIHRWLMREMTSPKGAFYSAQDSGEVGKEGEAYVWKIPTVKETLTPSESQMFIDTYNLTVEGNFREEATSERTGANIPYLRQSLRKIAIERAIDEKTCALELAAIREKLLTARLKWPQPHKDDKVLVSWNALMIESLAYAGRVLEEPQYTRAAVRAADFILQSMVQDGIILRSFRADQAKTPGYLDDYAYFASALLELHRATNELRWLEESQRIADILIDQFEDKVDGGFFFTTTDHDGLIVRSKHLGGGGNMPSPNGVAAHVMVQLAEFTGKEAYRSAADRTLRSLVGLMKQQPYASEHLLIATSQFLRNQASKDSPVETRVGQIKKRLDPVSIEISSDRAKLVAGEPAEVTVVIEIDPQWHLYAENEDAEFLKPTNVMITANEQFDISQIVKPDGIVKRDTILNRELKIYEGRIVFKIPITAKPGAAAGLVKLDIEITIQACDSNRCLQPKTETFQLPIEVVQE